MRHRGKQRQQGGRGARAAAGAPGAAAGLPAAAIAATAAAAVAAVALWLRFSALGGSSADVERRSTSHYCLIGLSLANEGIVYGGQPIFDQYVAGMQKLMRQNTAHGIHTYVGSNYANTGYNATHYQFIKDMNLLTQTWNVPPYHGHLRSHQLDKPRAVDDRLARSLRQCAG
eukprot:COSAG04_NODE_192_length_20873_cov_26.172957_13_plen_172_part_00